MPLDRFAASVPLSRRAVFQFGLIGAAIPVGVAITAISLGLDGDAQATPSSSPAATISASPAATPTATVTVRMTDQLRFDPPEIAIKPGDSVTWLNASAIPHTATGDPAQSPVATTRPDDVALPDGAEPWGSELLMNGDRYSHTFTVPGVYRYICIPHVLSGMRGTVTVEA